MAENFFQWAARNTGEYLSGKDGLVPGQGTKKKIVQTAQGKDADWIPGVSVKGGDRNPVGNAFIGRTAQPAARSATGGGGGQAPALEVTGGGGGSYDAGAAAAARQAAQDEAERNALMSEIRGMSPKAQALFADVFNRIKSVAADRKNKTERTYADQDAGYVKTYGEAVPQIDNAFAALGIGNSTYAGDRIDDAKEALDSSLSKSKENRTADLAEIGNWEASQRGAFEADQANINDAIGRSEGVKDVSTLRDARNNLSTTVNNISGKRQALNDEGAAIANLNSRTGRSANFDSAMKSLEGVLASSMDVGTKNAAKQALLDNAGLDDEEKKKLSEVQINNPYTAPVA